MLEQAIVRAVASNFDPASCLALLQHGCCSAVCAEFGRLPPPAQETMLLAVRDACLQAANTANAALQPATAVKLAQLGLDGPRHQEYLGLQRTLFIACCYQTLQGTQSLLPLRPRTLGLDRYLQL